MRSIIFGLALVLAVTTAGTMTTALAQGNTCFRLWVQRNSVYKANGFCFKTAQAIRYFGNAGCRYDDEAAVPLTPYDRAVIADIQAREQALGCQ